LARGENLIFRCEMHSSVRIVCYRKGVNDKKPVSQRVSYKRVAEIAKDLGGSNQRS